jgi:tyrosyl-DNA phosphodiesterase-1
MFEVPSSSSSGNKPKLLEGFQGRLRCWDGSPSGRQRAPAHMKCYFPYRQTGDGDVELAWFVLTSANLSQAAWGVYQTNGNQLYIKSYELGVLFLPSHMKHIDYSRHFSCTPSHMLLGQDHPIAQLRESSEKSVIFKVGLQQHSQENDNNQIIVQFPVPFKTPPVSYASETDYPWLWDFSYKIPDCLGCTRNL